MLANSKWIWHEETFEKNEYVDIIYDFDIKSADINAMFFISVDSEYELWINGKFVNCGQYDDYPKNKVYDTLCIGKYLQNGKNRIAITAYYQGEYSFQYSKGTRGMCFEIHNYDDRFFSSENVRCRLSKTYKNGEIYKTTKLLGFGYLYDARSEDCWRDLVYTPDSSWDYTVVQNIHTILKKRPIEKLIIGNIEKADIVAQGCFRRANITGTTAAMMYNDYLSHRVFEEIFVGKKTFPISLKVFEENGIYFIVDLGKESCGFLSLSLSASEGTVLDIAYGEHLQDLRVRSKIGSRNFANSYVCKEGRQEFTYYFKRIAGRYIEVHISKCEKINIDYISIKPVDYPLTVTGRFFCNDFMHNKIFEVCINTLKLCMHEHYEDCPWREQALYSYDSRNQALFGYYAFGEYTFPKASIELLGQSLKENGQLDICSPTDEVITIPSFSMIWLMEVKEYTEFSSDSYFVDNYWNNIELMVGEYTKTIKNGLASPPKGEIYWNFYEWSDGYDGVSVLYKKMRENPGFYDGVYNLILYMVLKETIWLAGLANKPLFIEKYSKIMNEIGIAFNVTFWNDDKKVYSSYVLDNEPIHYGELTQALALYTGICESDRKEYLCNALLNSNELVEITLGSIIFKYEALIRYNKKYAKQVFDDIAQKWGYMLYQGATSFWETIKGDSDFKNAGSLCHGWSAVPLYMYLRYISGITPQGKSEPITDVFDKFRGEAQMRKNKVFVKRGFE